MTGGYLRDDPRDESRIVTEVACSRVAGVDKVTCSPVTGRTSVRLSHSPGAASAAKKKVWPLREPPRKGQSRSSRLEGTSPPDWLSTSDCQKVAWDSTLIYFPFLLLLQSQSIPFCSRFTSCGNSSSIGVPRSFSAQPLGNQRLSRLLLRSTPFNLCDSILHHGSQCIGT